MEKDLVKWHLKPLKRQMKLVADGKNFGPWEMTQKEVTDPNNKDRLLHMLRKVWVDPESYTRSYCALCVLAGLKSIEFTIKDHNDQKSSYTLIFNDPNSIREFLNFNYYGCFNGWYSDIVIK